MSQTKDETEKIKVDSILDTKEQNLPVSIENNSPNTISANHNSSSPNTIKSLIVISIFSLASLAGSFIKLPSPFGASIALDSLFGFFCAVFFNPVIGGIVGFIGHLASAYTSGFPFGYLHLVVGLQMFFWCFIFGWIARRMNNLWGLILASVVAIILNGVVSPLILTIFTPPEIDMVLQGLIPFLLFAAAINIILAAIAVKVISKLDIPGI